MTAPHSSATPGLMPTADSRLSPFTGYTRAHWEAAADRLLGALRPYASDGLAQYHLPGRTGHAGAWSDGVEGYARSFLLAACRVAGAGGRDEPGGTVIGDLIDRYAAGLAAGTDPAHPEHWPQITDRAQPMVEAASVAIALHETRPWLWDRLDDRVRQNTAAWLGGFIGATANDSNWRLFQVIAEEFLASVGAPHRRAEIDAGLARLDDWYRGGGWYTDGDGQKFDYYNAFALHLYPVLWSRMAGPRADPALVATHRERLRAFLDSHQYFFGSDGAPLHQGRSLTYRYATAAPLWVGALADATPLPPGRTRRLASGALKHFTDHGVPGDDGLLSLGWYGPFLPATQTYSGPASPYWTAKAFLGLLLPPDHPVWTATEEPSPVDTADRVVSLPGPGWLLHSTAADGIVRLVNHGSDRQPPPPAVLPESPHYTRFAYSTATAPQTPPDDRPYIADNHIAVLDDTGATRRCRIHRLYVGPSLAASRHIPGIPTHDETTIGTVSLVHGPWEVRVHRVRAADGSGVRETGWAVAHGIPCVGHSGPGWAIARRSDGLTSVLAGLLGWKADGVLNSGVVDLEEDLNAVAHHSATPALIHPRHPGGSHLLVSLVVLTNDPKLRDDEGALFRDARAWVSADNAVEVRFPDGHRGRAEAELVAALDSGRPPCDAARKR
ncbi:DUF2264 domain-containing protein [Streptomyces sp. NPDC053750]|uniref:DUF2264 domain-containing protein n=1 Tax=Streptomyces sp. NPDC053750 TaxID=3365714 RepID=UPI0037CF1AB1